METFRVNFPKHQQLPVGWYVEYWECDEHYHYTCPEKDIESEVYSSRWQARKAALFHIKTIARFAIQQPA